RSISFKRGPDRYPSGIQGSGGTGHHQSGVGLKSIGLLATWRIHRMSQAEQRSFSFDPVANHYDATRGYPQEVSRKLAEALDQTVGGDAQTRFVEVGVGTGRIAIPLAALGCQYTGIDISEKMLGRLCGKLLTDDWQEWSLPWGSLPDEDKARKLEVWRFTRPEKRASL